MAKETKSDFKVTKSLQETVSANKLIKEVYFDEEGNHYFNKHKVKVHEVDENSISQSVVEVESLPGCVKTAVKIKSMLNGKPTLVDSLQNTKYRPIAATFSREEILSAQAVAEKISEKEKLEILRKAAEIAKNDDIEGLLKKINK